MTYTWLQGPKKADEPVPPTRELCSECEAEPCPHHPAPVIKLTRIDGGEHGSFGFTSNG
jgi:hypothetical protein